MKLPSNDTKPAWKVKTPTKSEFKTLEGDDYAAGVYQLCELCAALLFTKNPPKYLKTDPDGSEYKAELLSLTMTGYVSLLEKKTNNRSTAISRILYHAEKEATDRIGSRRRTNMVREDVELTEMIDDTEVNPADRQEKITDLLEVLEDPELVAFRVTSNTAKKHRSAHYRSLTGRDDYVSQWNAAEAKLKEVYEKWQI